MSIDNSSQHGITLKLQFRGKMNDSDEDANVDNVRVVAH